jgi:integrase
MGRRSGRAFTKRWIDTLKAGSEKGDWYSDRDHPGFLLRVYADGSKAFAVRYTVRGTTTRRIKSLGRLGNVTLEQARAAALEVLSAAALGGDPLAEKPALPTWGEWSKTHFSRLTSKSRDVFHRRLLGFTSETDPRTGKPTDPTFRDLRARWSTRPLDSFRTEDIEAERAALREAKGEPSANRWLAVVAACFQAAVRAELLTRNPAANVKAGRENPPRNRVLSPDEVARLLAALPSDPDQHAVAAVLLALLGGARRGEALALRWSDVNLDEGRATLPDSKSGKRRFLALVPYLVDFLRELPRDSAFVVAGRGLDAKDEGGKEKEERPRPDIKRAWDRITTAAGIDGATFHDLRRTFAQAMHRTAGSRVTQEALGHASLDLLPVYTPEGFDSVKAAAEKVAAVYPFPARRTA